MRFGDYVLDRLDELCLGQAELAKRLCRNSGYVSMVVRGVKPPPEDYGQVLRWADALRLDQRQTELLQELAELERTPPRIRTRYLRMRAELGPAA